MGERGAIAVTKLTKTHGAVGIAAAAATAGDVRLRGNGDDGRFIESDGANAPHAVICLGTVSQKFVTGG
ncbi:hypothetical protein MA16_Dca002494 [Dendrobium catenatum]|uniref:Uncharacterized protein n=1 Tax=Dendrobium catenatum TaxID=906689 RepID=A0A2I0W0N6_9ASPA|nr:hypothetical protein MA16_Dca002494 [Dendrobium catenatum]